MYMYIYIHVCAINDASSIAADNASADNRSPAMAALGKAQPASSSESSIDARVRAPMLPVHSTRRATNGPGVHLNAHRAIYSRHA